MPILIELSAPTVAYVNDPVKVLVRIHHLEADQSPNTHLVHLRLLSFLHRTPLSQESYEIIGFPSTQSTAIPLLVKPGNPATEVVVRFKDCSWNFGGRFVIDASVNDNTTICNTTREIKVFSRRSCSSHKRKQHVIPADAVRWLDGIGPTYSKRLQALGIDTIQQFSTLSKADVLNIQIRQQRGHMTRDKLLTLWHQARRICQLDDAVSLNEEPPKALTSTETPFVIDTKPTQLHSTIFVPTSDVKEEPSTIKALPTNPFTQHIQSRIFDFPIPSRLLSYNSLAIKFPAKYEELPPKIPIPEKKALPPVRAVSDPILALSQAAELLGDFVSVRL
eukprot:c5104_g1_i1.p1 GENE.c5104_g1_i1~~c5104_g1_i1.p1  ORF type:complete len:353 (+),score=57.78 c5104_g1_i1:59-1060(+)